MVDLSKIFIADLWTSDDFNEAPELKNILESGLIATNEKLRKIVNDNEAGFKFELPYVDEPDYAEPSVMDDSSNLITAEDFEWANQFAVLGLYAKSYKYSNLAAEIGRDSDPAKVIRDIIGNYWGRDLQRRMVAILSTIAQKSTELLHDVADDSTDATKDVKLSPSIILEAIAKQGDQQDKFDFLFVHSKVYKDLKEQDLIEMVIPSQNPALKPVPFYGKFRVIVNDLMPTIQGSNKTKYLSVIAQRGLFAYANKELGGNLPPLEIYKDPRTGYGSGETQVISRRGFVLHPVGWSFEGTLAQPSPTFADLQKASNWVMKMEAKKQKYVAIITN